MGPKFLWVEKHPGDSTSEQGRERTHHQMLGSFPKAQGQKLKNKETQARQSLDTSKSKNQNGM